MTVRTACQNHPDTMAYPARALWHPRKVLPTMPPARRSATAGLASFGVILIGIAIIVAVNAADTPAMRSNVALTVAWICGLGLAGLLCFGLAGLQVLRTGRARVRQQVEYYRLGEVPTATDHQLQALSLVAFACYPFGHWTETLETHPSERRVRHVPDHAARLDELPLASIDEHRDGLDEDWGVLTPEGCQAMIDRLLGGWHTADFVAQWELSDQAGKEAFRDRLLGLTGLPVERFNNCFTRDRQRPPVLIWAWDLWRAIQLARSGYCADLISEDEAWAAILRASDLAHALYPDHDSYRDGVLLGHAMWSNSLPQCRHRRWMFDFTSADEHRWPINSVPWVRTNVEFPPSMADGFAMEIELLRRQ